MPTEDEIFFDQATRSRGQVEVSFDQATRSRGQAAHKFTRRKWLETDGYSAFHIKKIAGWLVSSSYHQQEYMERLCTREDVLMKKPVSEGGGSQEINLHRPAGLPRVLLVDLPVVSRDQMIITVTDSFNNIGEMLDLALARVGLSLDTTYTEYESIFGVKKSGSELLFSQRCTIVKENIKKMKDKWNEEWVLVDESESGKEIAKSSIASVEKGQINTIFLGKLFFTRPTLEVAGFLIHEIGHLVGLQDICDLCHNIDAVKVPSVDPGICRENSRHGARHTITYPKALELAVKNPDLAIWNADAYRRYCLALYSAKLDVPDGGWQHHSRKPYLYLL